MTERPRSRRPYSFTYGPYPDVVFAGPRVLNRPHAITADS